MATWAQKIVLVSLLAGAGCEERERLGPPRPALAFQRMTMTEYNRGKIAYQATASAASGTQQELTLSHVHVIHHGNEETGQVLIDAQHSLIEVDHGGLKFYDGVKVTDANHRLVVTDAATYTPETEMLDVPGAVHFSGPSFSAEAKSLKADLKDNQFKAQGPIHGQFSGEMTAPQ